MKAKNTRLFLELIFDVFSTPCFSLELDVSRLCKVKLVSLKAALNSETEKLSRIFFIFIYHNWRSD